jgi:hypothetical protein
MPYRSCWIDRLHIVRWTAEPERTDFDVILRSLQDGHQRFGAKVSFLQILPTDVSGGDREIRKTFVSKLDRMLAVTTCVVVVLEGEGLAHSIRVNTMAGITLLARQRGLYVRNSLEDALLKRRPSELEVDGATAIKELQKRGLATAARK